MTYYGSPIRSKTQWTDAELAHQSGEHRAVADQFPGGRARPQVSRINGLAAEHIGGIRAVLAVASMEGTGAWHKGHCLHGPLLSAAR